MEKRSNKIIQRQSNGSQRLLSKEYSLGYCLHYGQGIKQDYNNAIKWYTKAASQGNKSAEEALVEIKKEIYSEDNIYEENDFLSEEEKEVEELVKLFKRLNFRTSYQVSQYIAEHKLGNKFRHISGYVRFENETDTWELEGGIAPKYYAEICKRLELNNNNSNSHVVNFDSFDERDF